MLDMHSVCCGGDSLHASTRPDARPSGIALYDAGARRDFPGSGEGSSWPDLV